MKKLKTVFYSYNEEFLGGGHALDPDEEGMRYVSRSDQNYSWTLKNIYSYSPDEVYSSSASVGCINNNKWEDQEINVGDIVYVIVVKYSTGSTFGRSNGHGTVAAVCVDAKGANETLIAINNGKPVGGYCPWMGYFEKLEDVSIILKEVL